MERTIEVVISAEQDGRILRDILRRELNISAKLLARIKRTDGGITLNGVPAFVTACVCAGDRLRVVIGAEREEARLIPTEGELDIRYEDSDLMVVNKPAGLPVQPAIGDPCGSLGNIVVGHFAEKGEAMVYRPVNRLDSGTSGLMVIAKNSHAQTRLIKTLHSGAFVRVYNAVVHGRFVNASGTVDAPIARLPGSVLARCVHPDGKSARTHYNIIEEMQNFSLLELTLGSGRTHQIRVHMSHIGHPLVGDFLYGTESPELIGRCALHSAQVCFTHPILGKHIEVHCEMPQDMQSLVAKIRA